MFKFDTTLTGHVDLGFQGVGPELFRCWILNLPDRPGIFIPQSTIHECPDVNIQGWVSPRLTQLILVGQYITIVLTFMISAETLNSVKTLSHLLLCNFRFYLHPKHPTGFKLLSVKIFNFCFYLLKCFTNIFEKGRKLT